MLLLDTDVLIDIQRGYQPAVSWFGSLAELPSVPGLVVMELIQDARNSEQIRKASKLVAPLPVVWPTEADCARALSDFSAYHLSHKLGPAGCPDRSLYGRPGRHAVHLQPQALPGHPPLVTTQPYEK